MKGNPAIISYDISSPKRSRRVRRLLVGWRLDGQKSVFECLLTQQQACELLLQLAELIDEDEDKLLFVWLDKRREARQLCQGELVNYRAPASYVG